MTALRGHAWFWLALLAVPLVLPAAPAYAYSNLLCAGAVPVGTLYDTTLSCNGIIDPVTGAIGLQNLFSGLVCEFQLILDEILKNVYCGIQVRLNQPLRAAIVIYVIIYGIQLSTGYVQANTHQVISRLIRIGLVWTFATNAAFGIGIVYNFFIDAMDQGISMVFLSVMPPAPGASTTGFCVLATGTGFNVERVAFHYIDFLVCEAISGPFTANGAKLAGFFSVLGYLLPPIFAMFMYFFVTSLRIFFQCLMSYLLCITSIAFLIVLSPIFLSLALFTPTYRFFDDWLRFMISFTLHIVLTFAAVALWISAVTQFGQFFAQLATMIVPIKEMEGPAGVRIPVDTFGLCKHNTFNTIWGYLFQCTSYDPKNAILPAKLHEQREFLFVVILYLTILCTVAYVFDALIKMIPGLAKQLAGPAYVPTMTGGQGTGFGQLGQGLNLFGRAAQGVQKPKP